MLDQEFADKKPSPTIRYADFVVSGLGPDDTVEADAKIKRFKNEEYPQILVSVNMLRIPVMAIGYSSRRRSLIPVIAIMADRQSRLGHDGSAARRRWRKQRLQD
jgi:hypothetical protein